jgi:hypothetical protein
MTNQFPTFVPLRETTWPEGLTRSFPLTVRGGREADCREATVQIRVEITIVLKIPVIEGLITSIA